ncbi:MAG TPA: radical SAM protein [Prolixibacteraceae bacterium]|nr:radical SAM protein [Prolixibacteraceae bacterium]
MATFLFDEIIFGPVISRRLGVSLGINLLPVDSKVCSFDCIYCECGRNPRNKKTGSRLPRREEVRNRLEEVLKELGSKNRTPDVITFAGNGEPTLHPQFPAIIDDTLELRNGYAPKARIAVLSNATMLHRPAVFEALLKVDDNIQKLDSAIEDTIRAMDCPAPGFQLHKTVGLLQKFEGKVTIQTMFIQAEFQGKSIDNTTSSEIEAWIGLLKEIKPAVVMIYTIARDTPIESIKKIPASQLNEIAKKVKAAGFEVQVSG